MLSNINQLVLLAIFISVDCVQALYQRTNLLHSVQFVFCLFVLFNDALKILNNLGYIEIGNIGLRKVFKGSVMGIELKLT